MVLSAVQDASLLENYEGQAQALAEQLIGPDVSQPGCDCRWWCSQLEQVLVVVTHQLAGCN